MHCFAGHILVAECSVIKIDGCYVGARPDDI